MIRHLKKNRQGSESWLNFLRKCHVRQAQFRPAGWQVKEVVGAVLPALSKRFNSVFNIIDTHGWEEMSEASGLYTTVDTDSPGSVINLLGLTLDLQNQNAGLGRGVVVKCRGFYLLKAISEWKKRISRDYICVSPFL